MNEGIAKKQGVRPGLKPYLWVGLFFTAIWIAYVLYIKVQDEAAGMKLKTSDMLVVMMIGAAAIMVLTGLVFGAVWLAKAVLQPPPNTSMAHLEPPSDMGQRYSLEIRGAGLAVDEDHQSTIWKLIQKTNNDFKSIYSSDPKDYPATADSRNTTSVINTRVAFRHSATDSVAYWPIPAFAVSPPNHSHIDWRAAMLINSGRNAATLGVTLFLWQDDENTTHAQGVIERLFGFFDNNPEVPQALIASEDGETVRDGYRVAGTPGLQNGHYVPSVYESKTGLLVSRTDRVNRYIRPFATEGKIDNHDHSSDLGKLWAFYWDRAAGFRPIYKEAKKAEGIKFPDAPGTMSTAYWQQQLPTLWRTLRNYGPGHFEPTPWLPVRWAKGQVAEFDAAPTLGYLHRPIKVSMRDEQGEPLKPALQIRALQAGWLQALETLPDGEKPQRVFYDSTDNAELEINLTHTLHNLNTDGTGLQLNHVTDGYNIGRRLGNTGVSSALVQINLATMASYQNGGVSAVVYSGADGSTTVQMVRPPDEATKTKNAKTRGVDPFSFGAPK